MRILHCISELRVYDRISVDYDKKEKEKKKRTSDRIEFESIEQMAQTILYNPYAVLFWDLKTVTYDIHTEVAT